MKNLVPVDTSERNAVMEMYDHNISFENMFETKSKENRIFVGDG